MMMPESKLPVAPFDTRAGTLKEVRAFGRDAFNMLKLVAVQPDQWTLWRSYWRQQGACGGCNGFSLLCGGRLGGGLAKMESRVQMLIEYLLRG